MELQDILGALQKKESAYTEKELARDAERSGNVPGRRDNMIKAWR